MMLLILGSILVCSIIYKLIKALIKHRELWGILMLLLIALIALPAFTYMVFGGFPAVFLILILLLLSFKLPR